MYNFVKLQVSCSVGVSFSSFLLSLLCVHSVIDSQHGTGCEYLRSQAEGACKQSKKGDVCACMQGGKRKRVICRCALKKKSYGGFMCVPSHL